MDGKYKYGKLGAMEIEEYGEDGKTFRLYMCLVLFFKRGPELLGKFPFFNHSLSQKKMFQC